MTRARRAAAVLLLAAGCRGGGGDPAPAPLPSPLPSPVEIAEGRYTHLATAGPWAVLATDAGEGRVGYAAVRVDGGRATPVPLRLPAVPECGRTRYDAPFDLGGGEVGFVRECDVVDNALPSTFTVVAVRLPDGRIRVVGDGPGFGITVVPVGPPHEYVVDTDSGFCSALHRFRGTQTAPLGVALAEDGWPLDEVRARHEEECRSHGRAVSPAYRAGSGLAFLASPDARGVGGTRRFDAEFGVYLAAGATARRVAGGFVRPRGLAWSADGRRLYVSAERGPDGPGLYAVTPDRAHRLLTSWVPPALGPTPDGGVAMLTDAGDPGASVRVVRLPAPA